MKHTKIYLSNLYYNINQENIKGKTKYFSIFLINYYLYFTLIFPILKKYYACDKINIGYDIIY